MLSSSREQLTVWLLFWFHSFSLSLRLVPNYAFNRSDTTRMTTSVRNICALHDHYSITSHHQRLKTTTLLNCGKSPQIGECWTAMSMNYRLFHQTTLVSIFHRNGKHLKSMSQFSTYIAHTKILGCGVFPQILYRGTFMLGSRRVSATSLN